MIDKEALLEKYVESLPETSNRTHYGSYARNFLNHADGLDKESVNRYLGRLRKEGKGANTVNFAFGVIRRLFRVNGLSWDFRRGEAPQVGQRDIYKPALAPDLIKVMIEAAKGGKLDGNAACFLALSTTYALRRQEMCDLQPGDVDLGGGTIFISTVKFGRERYHLVPDEIVPFLEAHDFSQRFSLLQMSQMFWQVVNGSGLEALKPHRLGWHSIRRTVKSLLDNSGLSPYAVHSFMRWKGVERELAMDVHYHATHFVGLEGTTTVTEEAEPDREVFEKHPFLSYWR